MKTYTFNQGKPIEYIIHLSDIHIRLLKRHDEYREVLNTLYWMIDDFLIDNLFPETLIVITGDLLHTKTDISPEMYVLLTEYLTKLSSKCPLIIIPGNHDLNLLNPKRLDAISPIVDSISSSKIIFSKYSEIFKINNLYFHHYSVLDDKHQVTLIPNEYNIALYHGPIQTAKTDTGFVVDLDTYKNTSFFDGFDIALLGDIHMHQQLQEYNATTNKPTMAYASSLIQQNYGESYRNHGFLLWTIQDRNFKFNEVFNNTGFFTYYGENDVFDFEHLHPNNVRIRVEAKNCSSKSIKDLENMIRKDKNVLEFIVKSSEDELINNSILSSKILDISKTENQNKLITDFFIDTDIEVSKDKIESIYKLNEKLNGSISDDLMPRNIKWTPKTLKFNNIFAYGEENFINFESLKGIQGMFAPNASGKTSAFEVLCFALFDKTPRAFKGDHILNAQKNECSCELIFIVDENEYKIIRRGTRKTNKTVKVDVNFERFNKTTKEWESLNGVDRRSTNAIIRSYVGEYEYYILTHFSAQGMSETFISKGQTDKKDLFNQFMGLIIFEKLNDIAIEKKKELQIKYEELTSNGKISYNSLIEDVTKLIDDIDDKLVKNTLNIDNINKLILDHDQTIEELQKILYSLPTYNGPTYEIVSELAYNLGVKLNKIDNQLISINTKLEAIVNEESVFPNNHVIDSEYDMKKVELSSYNQSYRALDLEYNRLKDKLNSSKITREHLSRHKYDPNCEFCINNELVKEAIKITNEIGEIEKKLDESLQNLNKISEKILVLEPQIKHTDKLISDNYEFDKIRLKWKTEKLSLQSSLDRLKAERLLLYDKLHGEVNIQLKWFEDHANDEIIRQNTIESIEKVKKQKKELNIELRNLTSYQVQLLTSQNNCKSDKISHENDLKKSTEYLNELDLLDLYLKAVGRNGIPYWLITQSISSIEKKINDILSHVVDFTISMELEGTYINVYIVYSDDKIWPIELASGMEKFISSLAIRVTLMDISMLPRSSFLIIDEGFGSLDSDGLIAVMDMLNILKLKFDFIVLISHLDSMKDIVDNIIEIKKLNEFSNIIVN